MKSCAFHYVNFNYDFSGNVLEFVRRICFLVDWNVVEEKVCGGNLSEELIEKS